MKCARQRCQGGAAEDRRNRLPEALGRCCARCACPLCGAFGAREVIQRDACSCLGRVRRRRVAKDGAPERIRTLDPSMRAGGNCKTDVAVFPLAALPMAPPVPGLLVASDDASVPKARSPYLAVLSTLSHQN